MGEEAPSTMTQAHERARLKGGRLPPATAVVSWCCGDSLLSAQHGYF